MKLRSLLGCILTLGVAQAVCAAAAGEVIEFKVADGGLGIIEVSGQASGPYRDVRTETLGYTVLVRGDTSAGNPDNPFNFKLAVVEEGTWIIKHQGRLYEEWASYKVSLRYSDQLTLAGKYLAPLRRCNDLLKQATGEAREKFLFRGETFTVDDVYPMQVMRLLHSGRDSSNRVQLWAPVKVTCLPLDPAPVRAKLRIEPANVQQIGKFLCPTELKLHGYVETRDKFSGKSIFIGPQYLSAITPLSYAKAGSRNMSATYKVNWKQIGGLTTAQSKEAPKQDLSFRLNVADNNDKVVKSREERVVVTCRKIKTNAPTTGGGMTINPTN